MAHASGALAEKTQRTLDVCSQKAPRGCAILANRCHFLQATGCIGLIIGQKGRTIQRFRSQFAVDLITNKDGSVIVSGSAVQVDAACTRLQALIEAARKAGLPERTFGRNVQLPPGTEAGVLGPKGINLKRVCEVG